MRRSDGFMFVSQPVGATVGFETPYIGQVGTSVSWLQCVWVDPGTRKVCVRAAVILLHVACRDGKALQEFCFIGT